VFSAWCFVLGPLSEVQRSKFKAQSSKFKALAYLQRSTDRGCAKLLKRSGAVRCTSDPTSVARSASHRPDKTIANNPFRIRSTRFSSSYKGRRIGNNCEVVPENGSALPSPGINLAVGRRISLTTGRGHRDSSYETQRHCFLLQAPTSLVSSEDN